MILTQTLAVFVDAYRDLNARKLFWITLILSLLFVAALAMFGVTSNTLTFLSWDFHVPFPKTVYKLYLLKGFVVDIWLAWAASILALISTGGIFPDFISGGAIDLYLCKPIGRLRLFLTKYIAGLMFVALQVSVVSVGIFVVVGCRIGEWRPSILMAIPLVLCFFSYIYCVCVLLGIMTRSTVAAILLTILVWGIVTGIRFWEARILHYQFANEARVARFDRNLKQEEGRLRRVHETAPATQPDDDPPTSATSGLERWQRLRDSSQKAASTCAIWHQVLYVALTVTPKGGPTIDLLDDYLLSNSEMGGIAKAETDDENDSFGGRGSPFDSDESVMFDFGARQIAEHKVKQVLHGRSIYWVIGTSLGFEAVLVLWAGWIFCRRDY